MALLCGLCLDPLKSCHAWRWVNLGNNGAFQDSNPQLQTRTVIFPNGFQPLSHHTQKALNSLLLIDICVGKDCTWLISDSRQPLKDQILKGNHLHIRYDPQDRQQIKKFWNWNLLQRYKFVWPRCLQNIWPWFPERSTWNYYWNGKLVPTLVFSSIKGLM